VVTRGEEPEMTNDPQQLAGEPSAASAEPVGTSPFAFPSAAPPPATSQRTFSLATLLLIITLVSVFLGITVRVPAAGVIVMFLALPALVRTVMIRTRRKAKGLAMPLGAKVVAFVQSLAIIVVICIASVGAFAATMFLAYWMVGGASRRLPDAVTIGQTVLAVGASGIVGVLLMIGLWPKD